VRPLAGWVFHDMRRTAASGMAALGIAPHVVEAVLNHRSGTIKGVAAVYNRYNYASEKRDALDKWAARVAEIVGE
jgi:integrase